MPDPWIYTPPPAFPALPPDPMWLPFREPRQLRSRFRMLGAIEPPPKTKNEYAAEFAKFAVAAGAALVAFYHGYRRNGGSTAWGLLWAGAGFWCPVVTIPFAWSQGLGKKA